MPFPSVKSGGIRRLAPSLVVLLCCSAFLMSAASSARAADEVDDLRRRVEQQEKLIREQADTLSEQQERMDRQQEELDALRDDIEQREVERSETGAGSRDAEASEADVAEARSEAIEAESTHPDSQEPDEPPDEYRVVRDEVGDLNHNSVEQGDFPGAIRIPGPWRTSLRIGGFVRVLAIEDTDAERIGSAFTPAALGLRRDDDDGRFSIDATLTRLLLDARAPTDWGPVRAYVEWDLNDANDGDLAVQWRHAYGSFETEYGTALVGQTWSTFMDLGVLPEGLAEPTVSGVAFQRQAMIRWSQPVGSSFFVHIAAENPSSDDVYADDPDPGLFNTEYPDGVLGVEYRDPGCGHLRLNSIVRHLKINLPAGGEQDKTAWGLALTGSVRFLERDRIAFSGIYGKGLGRYLLGIQSVSGAAVSPGGDSVKLNDNWGAMVTGQHYWTEELRSTLNVGYARAEQPNEVPAGTFESTWYGSANLLWSPLPFLTVGVEYAYGRRDNTGGSDLGNHRVIVGFQVF